MGYDLSSFGLFSRSLAAVVVLGLCLVVIGCGSSSAPSGEEVRQEREAAQEAREERESQEVKRELETGDFVDCGGQVFVDRKSLCTFAKNVQGSYYTEVVAGWGKPIGLHPPAEQDYRVLCSGSVPHKCTPFKDDSPGIESLESGTIFFSP